MAAEPTRIKLKRSTTATVVPTTSNLTDGEVALNIADRKLYVNNAGTIVEVANQKPNTGEVTTTMLAADITNGPGNTYYVATSGSNSNTLGSGGANGKHPDTPFLTVAKALSVATSGDTVNIAAGTYQEVFPLTVPDGVTLRGANLRSTQITPTSGTNDLNAFILEGDCHVSDLTVKDFFYNSGNDTGYGFVCASSLDSERSPYVERVTVLTKGSVTSASDPYGFAQGDAGRGAKLDGAQFSSSSIEAAILFNEVTFIVPNSVGLLVTNGVRVEWLNSFVYFAAEGIKGTQGATGRAGSGQTRLKLAGVSGTFAAAEVIYQLEDSFKSGTYSRSGTTVTVTKNSHGCQNGDVIYADFISGGGTDGYYTVANVATNTFEVTDTASGTTSGNITYKKADAYGTITTNDGTYLLINGKGVGEFTTGVPTGKTGVIAGDAQLDTAQKKFGTASLVLDGTTDHLNYPTDQDFGFGTTNFAVECFIRPASVSGTQYFLDFRDASASDTAPVLYLDGTTLHYAVGNTSQINGGTLATNTWYHVAVARSGGTTKLFLDGTELGTYSDSNDYGATKPLGIGGQYSGADEFGGHIDEVRISKASPRYTAAFTAPTAAFTTDLFTVLLLHFDGTDGSTTITDSGKGVKDIRSNGGDSATSLLTADYAQFGAELRSISSANIYGTKGAIADGAGVKLLLTAHNFAYIGSGADFTNDPDLAVPANEVTELNGGRVFYSATNEKGDFRIGDAFVVDQETGNVQFQSTSTAQEAANITLSDATGTTRIFPAFVETGNLRLSGNTLSSTSGSVIIDPAGNEDITLNAESIVPENLYFDTTKKVSIGSTVNGSANFSVGTPKYGGFSAYGLNSRTGITVHNQAIGTLSIDTEGTDYLNGNPTIDVVSAPATKATATATLDTAAGSVKTITVTAGGNDYTIAPTVTFNPTGAQASGVLRNRGRVSKIEITNGGSGYVSPTVVFSDPPSTIIVTNSAINASTNTITASTHGYANDDQVTYSNAGGTDNIGLTNGVSYYIINADTNTFQLSTSQGGSAVNLSAGTGENHEFQGTTATGTVQHSSGAVTGITITNPGFGYTGSAIATISDSAGVDATTTISIGYSVASATVSVGGTTYASAPTLSFTQGPGDTTGAGATGTCDIGFPISTVILNTSGNGYTSIPTVSLSGGTPTQDANVTAALDKENGNISSVTVNVAGANYSSAPSVTFTGGKGSEAIVQLDILPLAGNINIQGSGYTPGVYNNVSFTGGTNSSDPGFTAATATITIPGFTGTITNAGSGYTNNTYASISVYNNPTSTFTVTQVTRETLAFSYDAADDYEWNVVDNGANTAYSFTRVSATGTASGNNISITNERNDVLTFNVNASGHPFWIVSQLTNGAYDSQYIVTSNITNNGTDNGTIVWNTKDVPPGTYYYICSSHATMQGTITVSSYTGSVYQAGDTITGSTSGASGTVTSVTDYVVRFASVTNGPFDDNESITNGSVVATTESSAAQTSETVYAINGTEGAAITTALTHNTYRFDTSDSSVTSFSIGTGQASGTTFATALSGTPGSAGAWTDLILKPSAPQGSDTFSYGTYPRSGNYITVANGVSSQGSYGDSATADVTVSGGSVTSFLLSSQGNDYKINDVVTLSPSNIGSGGSGFLYTIQSNVTGVTSVTSVSANGGPYVVGDTLSADDASLGGGGGSGFQFQVSKVGFVDAFTITEGGRGFDTTDTLEYTNAPTTTGTSFVLSVATLTKTTPVDIQSDGSITTTNWSIDKDGVFNNTNSAITVGNITSSGSATISGATALQNTLTVTGNSTLSANLDVTGDTTITGSLTVNGTNNRINNAIVDLQDGSAADPALKFESSATTGVFHAGGDRFGFAAAGVSRLEVGTTEIVTTNNIEVDSTLNAVDPFLLINSTAETVDIGAPATKLRITNNATIQSVGSDANVDITIDPKGTGNLILTGGTDQDFSITDGSTETFRVDTETGNTTISGRLDINSNIRVDDNIISNIGTNAITSFGQIITVSATGTGTGFTDNAYTGVTSTSNGSGTGATFNVTVSGGDITVISVNSGGAGYVEGEEITLNAAQVGSGTGKTITVTDIEGAGLVLKPQAGKNVKVDSTAMFVVPSGNTNQRPPSGDRQIGGIRFNSEQQQFEGYNGTDFVSLGGVRDVDQDTYILTESAPGADEDTFEFYNQGVNSLSLNQTTWTLRTARTFNTTGTLNVNGTTLGANPFAVQIGGSTIFQAKSNKELEISGGLTLKGVPVLGEIASIGSITAGTGVYGASQTYSGVVSSSQFEGIGAEFTVVTDGSGSITSVAISAAGSGYEVNEVVTIAGNLLGGATPTNDVTFPVATLANAGTSFARMNILQQDFVTQLDNKPFISLDANGSEAAWKINRGWNGGTESYLTVMDSTADFVELDDCRVEGGQLTSFTTSSTLTQFDKTAYKGAKTLVTIESNDGKVHMLEVTSVCAAAGTNAYATVTNSVTSDNDLVDASIAVVGNNVQVTVTKSSAATSSTTFTGRFTTTKVKV